MTDSAGPSDAGEGPDAEPGEGKPDPERKKEAPRRPTPVRDLMARGSGGERDAPPEPPRVEIDVDGTIWRVEEAGRTRSGTPPDTGAPLLLLAFLRGADPSVERREAWAVGRRLADLSEIQLIELLERSRPRSD